MDPILFSTATAFGLASAAGLNTTLPLLLLGLAARFGLLTLATPYDAIGSDVALVGLAVLAGVEILVDKVPGADSVVQAVQMPLALAAGAILFASQQSLVSDVSPGLAVLIGLLTAGGVHTLRMAARPAINLATFGIGGPFVSAVEDVAAVALSLGALFAPVLAIVVLVGLCFLAFRLASRARRRRPSVAPHA
jgi:hypothetical protein